jgi:hypothetical protein
VDFAGGCSEFIVVATEDRLSRYDLESGSTVKVAILGQGSRRLDALYSGSGYNVFPFFK